LAFCGSRPLRISWLIVGMKPFTSKSYFTDARIAFPPSLLLKRRQTNGNAQKPRRSIPTPRAITCISNVQAHSRPDEPAPNERAPIEKESVRVNRRSASDDGDGL